MKEKEFIDELNQILATFDAKELLDGDRKYAFHPQERL